MIRANTFCVNSFPGIHHFDKLNSSIIFCLADKHLKTFVLTSPCLNFSPVMHTMYWCMAFVDLQVMLRVISCQWLYLKYSECLPRTQEFTQSVTTLKESSEEATSELSAPLPSPEAKTASERTGLLPTRILNVQSEKAGSSNPKMSESVLTRGDFFTHSSEQSMLPRMITTCTYNANWNCKSWSTWRIKTTEQFSIPKGVQGKFMACQNGTILAQPFQTSNKWPNWPHFDLNFWSAQGLWKASKNVTKQPKPRKTLLSGRRTKMIRTFVGCGFIYPIPSRQSYNLRE